MSRFFLFFGNKLLSSTQCLHDFMQDIHFNNYVSNLNKASSLDIAFFSFIFAFLFVFYFQFFAGKESEFIIQSETDSGTYSDESDNEYVIVFVATVREM